MSKYLDIIKHYENCFEEHGDTHKGMDWPNPEDALTRFKVMLDIKKFNFDLDKNVSLLDFGCGTGHLYNYIEEQGLDNEFNYNGLDISSTFIDTARKKFPNLTFYNHDILVDSDHIPSFDYLVMNGVFTEKLKLSFDEMFHYFKLLIQKAFSITNKGIAFNVMSTNVSWEREDLFHLPADLLTQFLCNKISRNYIIRNDYGLYEYTVYLFK